MRFTQSHEWVRTDAKGFATVGITRHAQDQVGDVVHVELPRVGAEVKAGEAVAVMESTKAAIDIYSPVSGTIMAVNEALRTQPQLINESPEDKGWLVQIALSKPAELEPLLEPEAYSALVEV
jgi:glycine cleavage system H protein